MSQSFFKPVHPFVTVCYYLFLLAFTMSTANPVVLSSVFISSLSLRLFYLAGQSKRSITYPLFFMLIIGITNPLFVHRGGTVLFFLGRKPITFEAFIYGIFMGMMIASVIYLFQNMQAAIGMEKFFYLFGQRLPKLTILLTLIFRFMPLFQYYFTELNQVQRSIQKTQKLRFREKAAYGLDLFGHLFTWLLETSMDTADAMKARGYTTHRSSRLVFQWSYSDLIFLLLLGGSGIFYTHSFLIEGFAYHFYPYSEALGPFIRQRPLYYILFVIFTCLPTINKLREEITWRILQSRI
ncbi:energy-coupling factor transporter transmembrane protein EcfT [Erwinia sp. CPCC 100877]|nr:energy-coupling factor transporter transmembrane protein EcfT [Erwinia sp. CPCC 100877]